MDSIEQTQDLIEMSLQQQYQNHMRNVAAWRMAKPQINPIMVALNNMGLEPKLDNYSMDIRFTGGPKVLADVVRLLRTNEWTTDAEKPKPGDTGWTAFFRNPACNKPIYLSFTSAVCKRVKVGTKMVEQDVYETQCGEGPLLLEQDNG